MTQRSEWHKWYNDIRTIVTNYRRSNLALAFENEQLNVQNRLLIDALRKLVSGELEKRIYDLENDIQQQNTNNRNNNSLITLSTSTSSTHEKNMDNNDNDNDNDSSVSRPSKNIPLHKKSSTLLDLYQNNKNQLPTIFEDGDDGDIENNCNRSNQNHNSHDINHNQNYSNNHLKKTRINWNDDINKNINNEDENNNDNNNNNSNKNQHSPFIGSIDLTGFSYELEEENDTIPDNMFFDYDRVSVNPSTILSSPSLPPLLPSQQQQQQQSLSPLLLSSSSSSSSLDLFQFHQALFSQHMPSSFPYYNNELPQSYERQHTKFNLRRKANVDYKLPTLKSKLRKGDRHSFTL